MLLQRKCRIFPSRMSRFSSPLFAVILAAFLIIMILMELIQDEKSVLTVNDFSHQQPLFRYGQTKKMTTTNEIKSSQNTGACPISSLKTTSLKPNASETISCNRVPPIPGSCDIAKELFKTYSVPTCSFQEHHEFCKLQHSANQWVVECDVKAVQICRKNLFLGLPSQETGELEWEEHHTVELLANSLTAIVQGRCTSHSVHYGFAFIQCGTLEHSYNDYYDYSTNEIFAEQLLILPPSVTKEWRQHLKSDSDFHGLSINILLVDSVSHQHLFRSLPKTVHALEKIIQSSTANVLDFELFQAIKSRTFETLQVIFSGSFNTSESPFGVHDVPPKPLNLAPIFKSYRDKGFKTLWLEDLCHLWEWGLSKDLHFLNLSSKAEDTWKRMWEALKKNGVNSVDVTLSMCRVLEANGVRDHFHGPEAVCFNGKHQHEYLLDYLKLYQLELNRIRQPYFTMTSTNVGHEDSGVRIQTLDQSLADYIAFTPSLDHTITIIFSDHGNAYGRFFERSNEAQVELYHPFMFFIIPPSSASLLGPSRMANLKLNVKRLVTALDLHYTLAFLGNVNSNGFIPAQMQEFNVSDRGLFDPVLTSRSCNSVPRLRPNVCICENSDVSLDSSSFAGLYAFMAVGLINEEIQQQYRKSLKHVSSGVPAFGNCQPLYLHKVTDIKETSGAAGQRLFQLNLHVQQSQVFVVSIAASPKDDEQPKTVLETVTRITRYGLYSNCSDSTVDVSLCICELTAQQRLLSPKFAHTNKKLDGVIPGSIIRKNAFHRTNLNVLPFVESVYVPLKTNPCLFISYVKHKDGVAIFASNECNGATYALRTKVHSNRKFVYFEQKEDSLLLPGGVAFQGLVVSEQGELWECSVAAEYHIIS